MTNQLLSLALQVSEIANAGHTAKTGMAELKRLTKRLHKLGCSVVDAQLDVCMDSKQSGNRANFKNNCAFLSTCVNDAELQQNVTTEFGYLRVSTSDQSLESQTQAFEAENQDIELVSEHGVSGTMKASQRPVLSKLLLQLKAGDTLWVWWFDRLGRDYHDAKETAQLLLKRGVTLKTIHGKMTFAYTGESIMDATTDNTINLLSAMADNERHARRASQDTGREAIKINGKNKNGKTWSELYAGRKANTEQHEQILRLVADGKNNTEIAKALGCSTKTVQRLKKAQQQ